MAVNKIAKHVAEKKLSDMLNAVKPAPEPVAAPPAPPAPPAAPATETKKFLNPDGSTATVQAGAKIVEKTTDVAKDVIDDLVKKAKKDFSAMVEEKASAVKQQIDVYATQGKLPQKPAAAPAAPVTKPATAAQTDTKPAHVMQMQPDTAAQTIAET